MYTTNMQTRNRNSDITFRGYIHSDITFRREKAVGIKGMITFHLLFLFNIFNKRQGKRKVFVCTACFEEDFDVPAVITMGD